MIEHLPRPQHGRRRLERPDVDRRERLFQRKAQAISEFSTAMGAVAITRRAARLFLSRRRQRQRQCSRVTPSRRLLMALKASRYRAQDGRDHDGPLVRNLIEERRVPM